MSNIIEFPQAKEPSEPMDEVSMCEVNIYGDGDITVWCNDYIQTKQQANWVIAKLAEAQRNLIWLKENMDE